MNAVFPVRQLSDVAISIDYGVTASASAVQTGTKFLRITDIQDGAVDWQTVPFCEAPPSKLRSAQLSDGDIVFARTGATTGKSFLIQSPPDGAVFASYLIRVRPSGSINPAYLAHFFRSKGYWSQIQRKTQGAAQGGVNATSLSEIEIPLPQLDEQRRIAAILDKADALRRKRKRALDLLENSKNSFVEVALQKASSGKTEALGEYLDFITTGGRNWSKYYSPQGSRFIRSLDVQMNSISQDNPVYVAAPENAEARRTRTQKGDVLLTVTGSRIGRSPNFRQI